MMRPCLAIYSSLLHKLQKVTTCHKATELSTILVKMDIKSCITSLLRSSEVSNFSGLPTTLFRVLLRKSQKVLIKMVKLLLRLRLSHLQFSIRLIRRVLKSNFLSTKWASHLSSRL